MFDSGGYPCKLQQEEFFIAPDGHNILLTIEYLFTEELYDVLRIGNGNDIKQGLLREYSGGPFIHEIEILSEGTMMWLTLIADGSINSIGFRGFVKSVNATAYSFRFVHASVVYFTCPQKSTLGTASALLCAEPHPPDELVSHRPDLPEGQLYPNGTEIMYECPEGWKFNGNDSAVCLYGEWTSEDAFCKDGELYLNGTEIMYECPDGWNLNGNTKAVCLYGMWTNENAFCSEILPTMCPFQSLSFSGVQLTFRATYPGSHVNSIQNCSEESSNAYHPLAMRVCDEDGWEEPVLTTCYTPEDAAHAVERITNTTVTEENVDEVASDLALVTTQTEDLDVSQVEDVAESLRDIANVNSSSIEVTESVVGTVNNLMEVNERSLEQTVGSSSVIVSLEQQISNVQKNPNNFTDVQHNVGVQAVKLDPDITKAVTFINLPPSNTTGRDALNADLAEENTRLFNNKQEVRTDNSTTSIYVPSKILELALEVDPTITHVPISFFIYKDSRLFQTSQVSSTSAPEKDNIKNRQEIASQVIAATLEHLGQNEVVKEEKCVFWSVSEDGKQGTWSAEGCTLTKDKNQTVCTCNHLTSFAVLVGIGSDLPEALSIITVVVILDKWLNSLHLIIITNRRTTNEASITNPSQSLPMLVSFLRSFPGGRFRHRQAKTLQ
ncbi:hypothetical protein BSL78_03853 [Apostichopus japonicus]|uniref:Uncharacterized protein n=1 Tax=Stichopus japonicus TaxID=307972 RepID=A0A2G8LG34_STIJA|nr:hypothetical protein BSL78_03853 [Apostichopus japonicus]